ncbi:MAG TPA: adenylate/guanylate cyclase domain-containing protein, partial [Candidatus Nanopelagicales bacterium]|nr:adenylate/guanylate cyclase domain-containing protein [Candidatus Nanopelagicales bacterium]
MSVQETSRPEVVIVDDPRPDVRVVHDLRRHIPRIALEWDDDAPGRAWQQVDATMVFADISGFTALTEKLARRGRIGAEELIETLNRIFGGMLEQAAIRGGELLKFGGDALLFVFRGDDHAFRACRSAVDMRAALREAAKIPTSVGKLKLSMSVGIHTGPVDFFLVGAPTRELLILGGAATATAEAEHAAVAGEILVTAGTAVELPAGSTTERPDGLHRLKWRFTYPPEGGAPALPDVPHERLRTLFPHALGDYLDERVPDPEHKVATIAFGRFSGTDTMLAEAGHDAVADALHRTISVFEEALIAEGGTLLATDIDSDGGKLFMGSGVPFSSEDDEGRMLRAMRQVLDTGTPLPVQIGINRGHVFAAEVGAPERAAYSAMGDTTNTAARIMSKAPDGVLFAHPSVLAQSRTLFSTEPAGPFPMKGKAVPVLVHAVGEEIGTREAQARTELELVGRDDELALLRDAFARALGGEGGVVTVSARTGLGKSRLISEAMRGIEATVVPVRAEPYGMTSPYRMLRDPVRQAFGVDRGDPEEMAETLLARFERLMPDLLPLAPLLADVVNVPLPPTPESAAIEPRYRPDRIADIVLRLLEVAVRGPLVIHVEEAHWADGASTTVLQRVAQATEGHPWALVVARRDEGEGFAPEEGTHLLLEPLPDDVMTRIVILATESAPLLDHEIEGIVARSGGNPLYAEELIRLFRDVGSLEEMPESLHAALDAQIDALDPHSRRVLRYASVLGRSFRREVLDQTLRGDDLIVDEATVERLANFLEPDGPGRLRFRTGMIRDAAYEGLAYRLRTRLHAAAGRAVETLSTDLEADADTLALHFWRGGDAPKTWRYARMAGDRAAHAYANVDAAVQYQRALDAARDLPVVPPFEKSQVCSQLAEVRDLAGLYPLAIDAWNSALRFMKDDSRRMAEILYSRAVTRSNADAYVSALRDLTKAEKLVEGDASVDAQRLRIRIRAMRSSVYQESQRQAQANKAAQRVIAEARALGEAEGLERALLVADASGLQLGDTSIGPNVEEAFQSALSNGRLSRAVSAANNLGAFAFFAGRWDDALERWAEGRRIANQAGDVVLAAQIGCNIGELRIHRGELDAADEVLAESRRVFRSVSARTLATYAHVLQARVMIRRGELEAAEQIAQDAEVEFAAARLKGFVLEAALVRAESLIVAGRPEEALLVIEAANDGPSDEGVELLPRMHLLRSRALTALGRAGEAEDEARSGLELARAYGLTFDA